MKQGKRANRDHELENVKDFGEVLLDPNDVAETAGEQAELDTERSYQPRDNKPSPHEHLAAQETPNDRMLMERLRGRWE